MNDLPKHNPYLPIDKQDADEIPPETEPFDPENGDTQQGMDDRINPGELDQLTGL